MEIKKLLILVLILIFTISSCNSLPSQALDTISDSNFLYVGGVGPNNYSSIQNAIDNASCGDTIFVYSGTYFEIIDINKSINLIGENKETTSIDAGKSKVNKIILNVTAENVKIEGFTIQNAKGIDGTAGIFTAGIFTRDNVFKNNIIKNCSYGVLFVNPINNIVTDNSLYGCAFGPYLIIPKYFDNTFENNTVNDKPVLFYVNEKDIIIDGVETDSIALIKCKNVEIKNLKMNDTTVGIDISYCKKIKVTNCTISNTGRGGIYVHHSNFCTFEKNSFIDDNWGVFFRRSNFNKINKNNFINVTMPDWFARSYFNIWNSNYWGKDIDGVKKILGYNGIREKIPFYNYDFRPSEFPYSYGISNDTYYVDDSGGKDFTKIQDAIDFANSGDTIYVCYGTYQETVIIDKSIKLIGENKENTIIDAQEKGDAVYISANNVTISNFTLFNTGIGDDYFFNSALEVESDNNIISNLVCDSTNFGMWFINSNDNKIKNNIVKGYWDGIWLDNSKNNVLRNNSMYGSGILAEDKNDIDESNLINDRITYYYFNKSGIKVPENAGQVILVRCSNFTLENLSINKTTIGISVFDSNNVIIRNNSIFDTTDYAILINNSDENIICNNHVYNNPFAISFSAGNLKNYDFNSSCNNNKIYRNNISNNLFGISIVRSKHNDIYENNFISNIGNVQLVRSFKNNFTRNYWANWIGLKLNLFKNLPKILPVFFTYKKIFSDLNVDVRMIPMGFIFDKEPSLEAYNI